MPFDGEGQKLLPDEVLHPAQERADDHAAAVEIMPGLGQKSGEIGSAWLLPLLLLVLFLNWQLHGPAHQSGVIARPRLWRHHHRL